MACACLEQVARCRSPDKHTPNQLTDRLTKRKTSLYGRGICAKPLANCHALSVKIIFVFNDVSYPLYNRQLHFRIRFITAALTSPIYSPSSQHTKLSNNNNFLSSIPIVHTISSSIISDIKNCGSPFE